MTLACATRTEERAARKLGARTALIGIGARRALPDGPVVSFGLAGGLHDGLECGEVVDATRVVDDPAERRRLHERTGADAIDMESGVLARTGRLAGCLRAISDTPERTLGPLVDVMDASGKLRPGGIVRALAAPRRTCRALADVRRALEALQHCVARPNGARA